MRRVLRILVRVLVVLVVVLGLAVLFRRPLFGGFLANLIAAQLSSATEGNFTVDGVEGGWFSDIVVLGLRGEADGTRIAVERIEVGYDLRGLLGDRPQDAISEVGIFGARIAADLTRPAGPPSEPFDWDVVPGSLPAVQATGSLELRTGADATIRVESFRIEGRGQGLDLALDRVAIPGFEPVPSVVGRFEPRGGDWLVTAAAEAAGGRVTARAGPGGVTGEAANLDLARLVADVAGRLDGTFAVEDGTVAGEVTLAGLRHRELTADRVAAKGAWDGARARLESVDAASGAATIHAEEVVVDPELPYAVASVRRIDVRVPDLRAYLPQLAVPIAVRALAASEDGRAVAVEEARLEGAGTDLLLKGTAQLAEDWRETAIDLTLQGEIGDLHRFSAELPRIEGVVRVQGEAQGTIAAPRADLRASGDGLRVEGRQVREVRLDAVLAWPRVVVRSLRLFAEPGNVEAYGEVDLEALTVKDGAFKLDVKNLAGFAEMFPGAPRVAGSLAGSGTFVGGRDVPQLRAQLEGADLAYEDAEIGKLSVAVETRDGAWRFARTLVEGAWGRAALEGEVRPGARTARIDTLAAEAAGRSLRLRAPAALAWAEDGSAELTGIDVEALGGRVTGRAWWRDGPGAELNGSALDLAQVAADVAGRADLLLRLEGDRIVVRASSEDLVFEGRQGRLSLVAEQAEGGLVVSELVARSGDALDVEGRARLPWRVTTGGLVRIDEPAAEIRLEGRIARLRRFTPLGGAGSFSLQADATGLRAQITVRDLVLPDGPEIPGESRFHATITPESAGIVVATEEGERGFVRGTVRSDRGADWTDPEALRAIFRDSDLDGALDLTLPSLTLLQPFLPERIRLQGTGHGTLAIAGSVRRPEVEGQLTVQDVRCSFGPGFAPFRDGSAKVVFRGRTVRIQECRGEMGHAPLSLSGTATIPDRGLLEVDLELRGTNVLLRRDRYLRLRADMDVAVKGRLDALQATGKVDVTDALYSRPIDLLARSSAAADRSLRLFSIRDGPFSKLRFDIEVTGDESFRIANNLLRGRVSLALFLRGTGEVPEPQGRIFFRDTLVKGPITSIKVDQGEIRFPPENPFVPAAQISAHTRLRGYDVDVQVSGEMPDFGVVVTTNPPMAQDDAILLVTAGLTREELERKGAASAAMTRVATYFGKRLVARYGGPEDPDEETFLDRFEIEVGSDVSRSGSETVQAEFEINRRWHLRGERDRFDDVNFGVVWRLRFP